jgi:hypothetical protein
MKDGDKRGCEKETSGFPRKGFANYDLQTERKKRSSKKERGLYFPGQKKKKKKKKNNHRHRHIEGS